MRESNCACDYCGVGTYKSPYILKRNKNNFCSKECSYKFKIKKIEVFCNNCGIATLKSIDQIVNYKKLFCCIECKNAYHSKKVEVVCLACKKVFLKDLYEVNRRPRNCCSPECFKIVNKYHKNWSTNRSKLECAIEAHICNMYPFEIIYNKTHIGYELDIHIPSLSLAIELNGIFHKKAIYGMKKLLSVQKTDREKAEECKKRNIKLIVIDVSEDGSSKKIQLQRIEEVIEIIDNRIQETNCKPEIFELALES
jgi:hypothetical protein